MLETITCWLELQHCVTKHLLRTEHTRDFCISKINTSSCVRCALYYSLLRTSYYSLLLKTGATMRKANTAPLSGSPSYPGSQLWGAYCSIFSSLNSIVLRNENITNYTTPSQSTLLCPAPVPFNSTIFDIVLQHSKRWK